MVIKKYERVFNRSITGTQARSIINMCNRMDTENKTNTGQFEVISAAIERAAMANPDKPEFYIPQVIRKSYQEICSDIEDNRGTGQN